MFTRKKVLLIIAILLGGAGIVWFFSNSKQSLQTSAPGVPSNTSEKGTAGIPIKAQGVVVQPAEFVNTVTLTGSVVAEDVLDVRSEMSGRIVKLGFTEGAVVSAGTLLVKLNDRDLQARLKKAKELLKVDEDKRMRLQKLKAVDGASTEDVELAIANVETRKADIAEIEAEIEKTEIRAPFPGRVGLRMISVGAVVGPTTPITTLTNVNALKLEVNIPERYLLGVKNGSVLAFTTRGADTAKRYATIVAVEPNIQQETRTQRVRARISKSEGLFPGMFANVLVTLQKNNSAILVPSEAIVPNMKGSTVFVVRNAKAQQVIVETGGRTATGVHIISGLIPGDTVLTTGLLMVKNNAPVAVELR